MSPSIEDWRLNNQPGQVPLPALLSKLNIVPRPERLNPDESALDTRSASTVDGSQEAFIPVPSLRNSPGQPAPASLSRSPSGRESGGSYEPMSLSKSNPFSPSRRASMVLHSSVDAVGAAQGGRGISRLTIVKAPPSSGTSSSSHEGGASGGHLRRRSSGGSARSFGGGLAPLTPTEDTGRLSFAFSSFGSPAGSNMPASLENRPGLSRRRSSTSSGIDPMSSSLTPREVVDLARETAQLGTSQQSSHVSGHPRSPLAVSEMEPVEFVPLADDLLLPFDDRPEEVKALLEAAPNKPLVKLISLALPAGSSGSTDPTQWKHDDLIAYLKTVGRDQKPDRDWVADLRLAVQTKSEALWEKLKDCLGIEEEEAPADDDDEGVDAAGAYDEDAGRIFIEGLPASAVDDDSFSESSRGSIEPSSLPSASGSGGIGVMGFFSPEAGQSSLPPTAHLDNVMESIGEEAEDSPTPLASRQSSFATGGTSGTFTASIPIPSIKQTDATPPASMETRDKTLFLPGEAPRRRIVSGSGPSSPLAHTQTNLPLSSSQLSSSALSMTSGISSASSSYKPRTKSFVGISILSSSPGGSGSGDHSGPPSHRRTSFLVPSSPGSRPDDHHYGDNRRADPMTERGPGSPLFPTSFSNLSLSPFGFKRSSSSTTAGGDATPRRTSTLGSGGNGGVGGGSGQVGRQWAQERKEQQQRGFTIGPGSGRPLVGLNKTAPSESAISTTSVLSNMSK